MNVENNLILGIDAGNYEVKVYNGDYGVLRFDSAICEWFRRDIEEVFGDDDMEFEIDGERGYAGTIARYEDTFGIEAMYGISKAHGDSKIKTLLAIYRYIKHHNIITNKVSIVVGQPVKGHVTEDKEYIINMLKGKHEFTVNGETINIEIVNCGVCAEGAGSFWAIDEEINTVKIIDLGSGTANLCEIRDKRVINNGSDTMNIGSETGKNKQDVETLARGIIRGTTRLQWKQEDEIRLVGGNAEKLLPHIQSHYPNTQIVYPSSYECGTFTKTSPTFSNAIGFYKISRASFS